MEKYFRFIDSINDFVGRYISYLFLPLVFMMIFEVVARYIFNRPTQWNYDFTSNLMGYYVFLGAGYTYLNKGFINMDAVYSRLPERKKAIFDTCASPLGFIFLTLMVWSGWKQVKESLSIFETSGPPVYFPIYPLKVTLVAGAILLWFQFLVSILRKLQLVLSKEQGGGK
jgi:TRAP-type mannitol/chloroaromatic compound transport system permease small subunit